MFGSQAFTVSSFASSEGSTQSAPATVTLQPQSVTVEEGQTAVFTAGFENHNSVQWYRNGNPIAGQTSLTLSVVTILSNNGDTFYATATGNTGAPAQTNTATLTVTEASTGVVTFNVNITAEAAPVPSITLTGGSTVTHAHGSPYTDAGFTADDGDGNDITNDVTISGSVNVNAVGQYILSYDVTNQFGVSAPTLFRTVNVTDQTAPVITLNGSNTVNHTRGTPYTDAGATATDAVDGDLTGDIAVTGVVDINTTGPYTITYNVSDAAGNAATPVTRTVNVTLDGVAPVITLTGGAVTLNVGDTYTELGYSALDNVDGDITADVVVGGDTVNTSIAGLYVVTYDVTDSAGNAAQTVNRLVTVNAVIDVDAPDITLLGANPVDIVIGSEYVEAGYTALDNLDGIVTDSVAITGAVDTDTLGTYQLLYSVTDAAGNTGNAIRTVNVVPVGLAVATPLSRTVHIQPGSEVIRTFIQDSSDYFDYVMDFGAKLQGDPIITVRVDASGLQVSDINFEDQRVQVWVSGSADAGVGMITINATTRDGRRIERSFKVKIGEY